MSIIWIVERIIFFENILNIFIKQNNWSNVLNIFTYRDLYIPKRNPWFCFIIWNRLLKSCFYLCSSKLISIIKQHFNNSILSYVQLWTVWNVNTILCTENLVIQTARWWKFDHWKLLTIFKRRWTHVCTH